ncbi:uncharacterized protein LOC135378449 isoform X2 [Ornithodoros turicata]|uniref:uncharacterized protein LOC135378449 isoform X2 n=1 Tax=Ornithodoros turicata TaxID=34597 RepID=UPI003139605B
MYYLIEKCAENSDAKVPSWSESDLLALITEYWKRRETMRPKASETVTNMQRRQCWLEITDAVNARCFNEGNAKTMDQLKRKWERTLMLAKKAALNIQRKNGNLSDLTPAYQLALSIVCDDFPLSLDCASTTGLGAPDVTMHAESSTSQNSLTAQVSRFITEPEEDSSLDASVELQVLPQKGIKAEVTESHSCQENTFERDSNEAPSCKKRKREEGAPCDSKIMPDRELIELKKQRVQNQICYEEMQHKLQMNVLRAQLQFWERKMASLDAE